jgi:hypothetical protein
MVQNQKFAAAIDAGLAAAAVTARLQRHPHAKVVTCARSRPTGPADADVQAVLAVEPLV